MAMVCWLRITPAHAGKSLVHALPPNNFKDHPRSRGEKQCLLNCRRLGKGSPPLTRGKAIDFTVLTAAGGITPAHAGKSSLATQAARQTRDHPRSRGEKSIISQAKMKMIGSPPLTRGKVRALLEQLSRIGITPAHAGKSRAFTGTKNALEDHPRSRGEKLWSVSPPSSSRGSPPLTRGKVLIIISFHLTERITPAHAGKRPKRFRQDRRRQDHPRSRGEKRG